MSTFKKVVNNITANFEIDGPHDISYYFKQDGEKWLYDFLKSKYQVQYDNNYKLVLYFDKDEYLYSNLPGSLTTALQKIVSNIDISHFFIILITTDTKIKEYLDVLRKQFSTDSIPIEHILVDNVECSYIKPNKTHTTVNDTVCVHPWFNLYIGPAGDIQPCCDSDHSMSLGNIKDYRINEIINSSNFNNIRKTMLDAKRPIECARCYSLEDQNIESKRNKLNKKYNTLFKKIITKNPMFNTKFLDLNLGNTCNFKCRMCTGFSSSKLRSEEIEINTHGIEYKYIKQQQIKDRVNEITQHSLNAEKISFAGGESMLINEYNTILDFLIANNKSNVDITYSTNLSILPENVLKRWKFFNNITVIVSLDAINEVAEYYRNGTVWSDIERNFIVLSNIENVEVIIRSTISIYNAFAVIDFQKKWITENKSNFNNSIINIVEYPEYLSIQVLPTSVKNKLNNKIKEHIEFLNKTSADNLIQQWKRIQKFMYSKDLSHRLDDFFKYTDKLDKHRGEKFSKIFNEYNNLKNGE